MVFRREVVAIIVLCLLVTVGWCFYYARWPGTAYFRIPVQYEGDALMTMAVVKGFSEFPAPWNIEIKRLGAPYSGNWNDYPFSEKIIYYPLGLLAHFLDPGLEANLALIFGHLFSAIGFYIAARYFGVERGIAVGFALLYGLSSYIFMRSLGHLILSYYGHLPLMLVVFDQALKPREIRQKWAAGLALFLVVITGLMNPYYWFFFLAMAGLIGLIWLARGSLRDGVYSLSCAFGLVVVFFLGQSSYYVSEWRHGPNPSALSRSLNDIFHNGLRLPSLIWPPGHFIKPWGEFAMRHYFSVAGDIGERSMPFLGIAGVIGLGCMVVGCFIRAARGRSLPIEAWATIFAMSFATIGGLDYLLGSFGFVMLRSVNRYSIIILGCVYLFMGARLFPRLPRLWRYVLLLALIVLSVCEVSYLRQAFRPSWGEFRRLVLSDRVFGKMLDQELPPGACVFLLPLWVFPEAPHLYPTSDYEPFRSYIWSEHPRFSYGSDQGRHREMWQQDVVELPPAEMVQRLEKAGFSAIVIDRRAYVKSPAKLEASLRQAGLSVLAESPDHQLVAYRIQPAAVLEMPLPEKPELHLGGDFYGWEQGEVDGKESRWSWSSRSAKMHILFSPVPGHQSVLLHFRLVTLRKRDIRIEIDGREVAAFDLPDGGQRAVTLQWTPRGEHSAVLLHTDRPGKPGSVAGDSRLITFGVFDPQAEMGVGAALDTPRAVITDLPTQK